MWIHFRMLRVCHFFLIHYTFHWLFFFNLIFYFLTEKLQIIFLKYLKFEKIVVSPFNSLLHIMNWTTLKSKTTLFHVTKTFNNFFFLLFTSQKHLTFFFKELFFFPTESKSERETQPFFFFKLGPWIIFYNFNSYSLWSFIWSVLVGSA